MYQTVTEIKNDIIKIDESYCGPPGVGNGGYVAGCLAQAVVCDGQAVQVTLRRPIFVNLPVRCHRANPNTVELHDGDTIVAEASVANLDLEVPPPPSLTTAAVARLSYRGWHSHPFANCFVCGPKRQASDGLRIFPGPVGHDGPYAAPWKPHRNLSDANDTVKPEFVWAALDCPGAFAAMGEHVRPLLLGRIAAQIYTPLIIENDYVVASWLIAQNGRKHHVGSAVFTTNGILQAKARAVWFDLK
ncbi:hypothetical protein [Candidatus Leptofilum sp.]|uniref:hypothetical protein n=1 Tax=Candidatus Leptofilum sp. TaxID=3241576 RepID=UPI003B59EEDB